MNGGPLGKYSQGVAAFVAVSTIAVDLALHAYAGLVGLAELDTSFVDNVALIAFGAVFGAAASTSVNGAKIEAAHRRLDILAAPPADSLELSGPPAVTTRTTVVTPATPASSDPIP